MSGCQTPTLPTCNSSKHAPSVPMPLHTVCIYISISLSPRLPHLCRSFSFFSWTEKRRRFFSWETLGEVCCSVSREWEWNPVFLGLNSSLPVPWSHPKLGVTTSIVSGLAAVLGNSRPVLAEPDLVVLVAHSNLCTISVNSDPLCFSSSLFHHTEEFQIHTSMEGTYLHLNIQTIRFV